jgi:hypothetical protein
MATFSIPLPLFWGIFLNKKQYQKAKYNKRRRMFMVKLTCGATDCVHNSRELCTARSIHVGGISTESSDGTQCDTFSPKGVKNAFNSLGNMNLTGEFKQLFTKEDIKMSPGIGCSAEKCIYNEKRICTASDVRIEGTGADSSEATNCGAFIMK